MCFGRKWILATNCRGVVPAVLRVTVILRKVQLQMNLKAPLGRVATNCREPFIRPSFIMMVNLMSRELFLKMAVHDLKDNYDYILIDCMPSLGMLTINALAASDEIITPVQAAYLPAKGLEQFLLTVSKVRKQINRKLKMEGILLSMVDARTNYAKEIISLIYKTYGTHIGIFQTQIPFSVRAAEASAAGCSIFAYDPHGKVSEAYRKLPEEVTGDGR